MEKLHIVNCLLIFMHLCLAMSCTSKAEQLIQPPKSVALEIVSGQFEKWKNKAAGCIALLDTYALTDLIINKEKNMDNTIEETKEYIGMWVTADGHIRHELLANNRYDEARGNRKKAYLGSYKITGNHIDYKDDTGFIADGDFKDGILYHAGMILYKEKN